MNLEEKLLRSAYFDYIFQSEILPETLKENTGAITSITSCMSLDDQNIALDKA